MALRYEVSPERRIVTVTATGTVTREDFNNLRISLLSDDRINAETALLLNANDANAKLSFTDLQEISARLQGLFEKGIDRVAIVASSTFHYSLAKTFGVFAKREPVTVRPFRDLSEAVAWLQSAA